MSNAEIDFMVENDMPEAVFDWTDIDEPRQSAIISMRFALGPKKLKNIIISLSGPGRLSELGRMRACWQ